MKSILYLILISCILGSPAFFTWFKQDITLVYYANDYRKMKVKVDSLRIWELSGSEGDAGTTRYSLYSLKYNKQITLIDSRESVTGRMFGDTLLIPQLYNYMENHHDSIWVWYHPKAQAIYAKEDDVALDITPYKQSAFFNFLGLIGAVYGLFYLINQKRKSIKANEKNALT